MICFRAQEKVLQLAKLEFEELRYFLVYLKRITAQLCPFRYFPVFWEESLLDRDLPGNLDCTFSGNFACCSWILVMVCIAAFNVSEEWTVCLVPS